MPVKNFLTNRSAIKQKNIVQGVCRKNLSDGVGKVYSRCTLNTCTKNFKLGIGVSFYNKNLAGGVNSRPSIIHYPKTPQVKP